jgi:multicomponent Na+:H+ antiporter subunit A
LQSTAWVPSLDLNLAFRFDGLSLLFLLLISGIGALISIYAGGYLHHHRQLGRFFACLFFFMGAMLGLVAADNLLALFIFWELTSLSSYLLIGFNHEEKVARGAALQALLVTFTGGQALLIGLMLLSWVGGTYSFTGLLENIPTIQESGFYPLIIGLVLAGAFTKSAQTPFHFWLPGAMAAPTPVSAYLHSATMVTAGVFLMARLTPILGGTPLWMWLLSSFGLLTMITGSVLAVGQTDLKRLLAYTTVGALGTMTLLLGLGSALAAQAAVAFLLVHSLYKGSMFMMAGAVDHETHTRDVRDLGGLIHRMPITAVAAGLAALAMCGVPPVLGFISKELLYEAQLQFGPTGWGLAGLAVLSNALVFAVALIVGVRPFFGQPLHTPRHPHEAPPSLWLGPMLLAGLGLVFGLFPMLVDKPLLAFAAEAILQHPVELKLTLWHGLTPMLMLSLLTIALGVVLFKLRHQIRQWRERCHGITRWGPERAYELLVYSVLPRVADGQTRLIQHGYLRYYIMTVMGATALAIFIGISRVNVRVDWLVWRPFEWYEALICLAILGSAVGAIVNLGRLSAVALLGIVGYSIALIFALYGAPDLALTQFLVETLTLILLVLVLYHIPKGRRLSSIPSRWRDGFLSLLVGLAVTLMVMKALSVEPGFKLPDYFMTHSVLAQGRDVVNVILVDFRALDTLGEITVLAMAALGVYGVLRIRRRKPEGDEDRPEENPNLPVELPPKKEEA